MKSKFVKIAAIQAKAGGDLGQNLIKTAQLAQKAAQNGAKIICLQELFRTPYFPQYRKLNKDKYAESIPGVSTMEFKKIAKKYGIVIIVPIYEKSKNKKGRWEYHNSAVVIDENGKFLPTYRKTHIPQDPGFYEKDYFEASDSGYKIYKTKFGTFAVLICFDQWFPEAARVARLQGAQIIFYPTAIGNILGKNDDSHDAWEVMQRSHAIANSVHVVAVNRVGVEGRLKFFGQSFISDPFGKIIKRGSGNREEIITANINLSRNKFLEDDWGFLRNRRPDTYNLLTSGRLVEKSKKLKNAEAYKKLKKLLGKNKRNG